MIYWRVAKSCITTKVIDCVHDHPISPDKISHRYCPNRMTVRSPKGARDPCSLVATLMFIRYADTVTNSLYQGLPHSSGIKLLKCPRLWPGHAQGDTKVVLIIIKLGWKRGGLTPIRSPLPSQAKSLKNGGSSLAPNTVEVYTYA